jgi:hexosaminidase
MPLKLHQAERRLAGQASLWTEQTDRTNMETVMWPRAAALAEVFWNGPGASQYPLGA